ncbi:DNA topology modulation protein FlaR [Epibacterium sp. SM1969]|uniref:DNA topology modulation protein FlaR n=2 Tax=Tritonibacter aquimaris TaxID=2663379 RepID=A0A844B169_9RHOB|nr:DNA topology modulation protein FlaR [Tritonibacter aquimaris]
MKRIVVTGANGAGKSHFAAKLASVRPDVPVISYDALKLKTRWEQKKSAQIEAALASAITQPTWILEGGPSLIPQVAGKYDALIWLDPPEYVRAWRLAQRPWKHLSQTRPELPGGNVDWPIQQYRFAFRSLRKGASFRSAISVFFEQSDSVQKWRCRTDHERDLFLDQWESSF